jgi:hypothetical protein
MNRMTHDAIKHADDADFTDLRGFSGCTKSPKDLNMDNPLQAAGAVWGSSPPPPALLGLGESGNEYDSSNKINNK